jgi:hypothetical protein
MSALCCVAEKVYLADTGGSLYDGQQQVLYWADVSSEVVFIVPSPTSHALAAGLLAGTFHLCESFVKGSATRIDRGYIGLLICQTAEVWCNRELA